MHTNIKSLCEISQKAGSLPALKEWAIAVSALTSGKTILLLRKGGIREQARHFSVVYPQALLYPTYEHQQPYLLKPPYAAQVQPVEPGWHPDRVAIAAWADITHVLPLSTAAAIAALLPFHIWTADFAIERLRWKPRQPIYALLLRVYAFEQAQPIPYCAAYGGCRSWLELGPEANAARLLELATAARPVLSEAAYTAEVNRILEAIAASSTESPALSTDNP